MRGYLRRNSLLFNNVLFVGVLRMKITINAALRNYLEDLRYQGRFWDRENLNYCSSGTPEFEDDAAMNEYIDAIASLITEEVTA